MGELQHLHESLKPQHENINITYWNTQCQEDVVLRAEPWSHAVREAPVWLDPAYTREQGVQGLHAELVLYPAGNQKTGCPGRV